MLRAALIGAGSSGKTTLFQLMTSVKETSRGAHGKGEATIGISKVPDGRLDRLTAMYNPKKRVPATVEFSDLAIPGGAGGGVQNLNKGQPNSSGVQNLNKAPLSTGRTPKAVASKRTSGENRMQ